MSDSHVLNNGFNIPAIGFGTFRTAAGKDTEESVTAAIRAGYRLIDGAAAYQNEQSVGLGIRNASVRREDLFITSKLWNKEKGYDPTIKAVEKTLSDLQLAYLDLYLIHWPIGKGFKDRWKAVNRETWRAFEELAVAGKIRSLGVSNFRPHHLDALLEHAKIQPAVNQIEFHPGELQPETVKYCQEHKILVEAWAPLSNGAILKNADVLNVADKYHKSAAQVVLRWIIQKGIVPLPKSITPSRIRENLDVFAFALQAEDVAVLDRVTDGGSSGLDPDLVDF